MSNERYWIEHEEYLNSIEEIEIRKCKWVGCGEMTPDTVVFTRRNGKKTYALFVEKFGEVTFICPTGMNCLGEVERNV